MAKLAMEADLVRMYLKEIGKTKLLSAAEEVELAKAIQELVKIEEAIAQHPDLSTVELAGMLGMSAMELHRKKKAGERAKEKMVRANLRLVVSIAKQYTIKAGFRMDILDLIQEGSFGLIRAAEKFDHTKGYKFSTYATHWVRQGITRAIANQSKTIRMPVHLWQTVSGIKKAARTFCSTHDRYPTDKELAELTSLSLEKLQDIKGYLRVCNTIEGDRPVGTDAEQVFFDMLGDPEQDAEETLWRSHLHDTLDELLSTLSEREQAILRWRYIDGKPLSECGELLDPKITRERVRQIECKALKKLKRYTDRNPFKAVERKTLRDVIVASEIAEMRAIVFDGVPVVVG